MLKLIVFSVNVQLNATSDCDGVALDSNTPKLINLNNLGFEVDVNYELVNPDDINLLNLFINTIEGNIRISYGTRT